MPSAWSDESKAKMRVAAYRGGLIKNLDDDAVVMILEPEAAALHAKDTSMPPLNPGAGPCGLGIPPPALCVPQQGPPGEVHCAPCCNCLARALPAGMTVCVLDAGGGTVDISVHMVEERGGSSVLADALWSVGELCGSTYIDQAFW